MSGNFVLPVLEAGFPASITIDSDQNFHQLLYSPGGRLISWLENGHRSFYLNIEMVSPWGDDGPRLNSNHLVIAPFSTPHLRHNVYYIAGCFSIRFS